MPLEANGGNGCGSVSEPGSVSLGAKSRRRTVRLGSSLALTVPTPTGQPCSTHIAAAGVVVKPHHSALTAPAVIPALFTVHVDPFLPHVGICRDYGQPATASDTGFAVADVLAARTAPLALTPGASPTGIAIARDEHALDAIVAAVADAADLSASLTSSASAHLRHQRAQRPEAPGARSGELLVNDG